MIEKLTNLFDYETEPQYYSLRVLEREILYTERMGREKATERGYTGGGYGGYRIDGVGGMSDRSLCIPCFVLEVFSEEG